MVTYVLARQRGQKTHFLLKYTTCVQLQAGTWRCYNHKTTWKRTDSPLFCGPQVFNFISYFCYLILQPLQNTAQNYQEEDTDQIKISKISHNSLQPKTKIKQNEIKMTPPPKSKNFWKIHLFNKYFLGSYQIVNILGNTKVKKIPPDLKEFTV